MVVSVGPAPQSLVAGRQATVTVTFDRPVTPTPPVVKAFGRWSGPMAGTVDLSADRQTMTFTPAGTFAAGEWVTITVTGGVVDDDGEPLAGSYSWNFWVASGAGSLTLTPSSTVPIRRPGEGWIQSYGSYAGDLNGDGYPDLIIPNERSNDIRVFANDGAGGYSSFTTYAIPSGARPSTNDGADFDGDGIIDFAVGNSANSLVSLFRGGAGGTLSHAANYVADQGVRGLCLLDLDGDGAVDLVTANRNGGGGDGNVSLFINDGSGAFGPGTALEAGGDGETACAAADANGDGIIDVFVGAVRSREVILLLGDGRGGLRRSAAVGISGGPWMLAAGDVDGDGHADVVSANTADNSASIVIGDGAGGLRLHSVVPVGIEPIAVDLGDLDGDGDLDLVTSNFGGASWTLLENDGRGAFGNPRVLAASSAGSCAVLVDRDNDGDLDLIGIDELDDLLFLFTNR